MSKYPMEVRQEALREYMEGRSTLPAIASRLGVPVRTLHGWHSREKWAETRRRLRAELFEDWMTTYRRAIKIGGAELVVRHFKLAAVLCDRIGGCLSGSPNPQELSRLASALAKSFKSLEPYLKPVQAEVERPPETRRPLWSDCRAVAPAEAG